MRTVPAGIRPPRSAKIGSPVPLERLLEGIDVLQAQGDLGAVTVTAISHDSTTLIPGALFCCLVGRRSDGHDHAPAALEAGAVALLCERPLAVDVLQVIVADARAAMAPVAAAFYGHPSRHLTVAGVTGTNGKTTVTHLLRSVFEADGRAAGAIGTLSGARTTPEAPELQARLAELLAGGTQAVAMEVSSHALAQHRVDATWFEVVGFTNLSQDHLDYHGDMETYFQAKATLFDPERAARAVINADDPWGARLLAEARLPARPFSLADAEGLELDGNGASFRWEGEPVRLRLAGRFNVVNALAAAALARELGVGPASVAAGIGAVETVPGRFERVDGGGPVAVVVDYAHTPAGLEHVLGAARQLAGDGRVLVVFGCGGDRDQAKRPAMGEAATRLADVAVLTSDNPRSEDPAAIVEQVRAGVRRPEVLIVEPDRRAAIALAVGVAQPGDVVVVAGKGHEATQVTAGVAIPFDDREVAREELERVGR